MSLGTRRLLFEPATNYFVSHTAISIMRIYRGLRITRRALTTSTVKSAGEKSTDEKAAEMGASAWPMLKKYGILIVPGTLGLLLTVVVVNEPSVRYSVESYAPGYVDFLRKYYGFGNENLPEVRRVQALLQVQAQEYVVTLKLANGQTVAINTNGGSGYQETVRRVEEQYKSQVLQAEFDYAGSGDDVVKEIAGVSIENSAPVSSDISIQGLSPLALRQRSHWQASAASLQSSPNSSTQFSASGTGGSQVAPVTMGSVDSPDLPATHKILNRVANQARGAGDYVLSDVLGNRLHKLESYSTATRAELKIPRPLILEEMDPAARKKYVLTRSSSDGGSAHSRESALEAIRGLELQIQALQRERQIGARDMDAIEKDIRGCRDKITSLRRNHINYFYYF